jgi:hypothetical protein
MKHKAAYLAGVYLISVVFNARAQGLLTFNNRGLAGPSGFYDAPVSLPDGTRAAGDAFTAGLFLVGNGSLSLIATTPFRSGAAAGFFVPQESSVPGVAWGAPATVRVRVWETAAGSYENAVATLRLHGEFPTANPANNIFIPRLAVPGEAETVRLDGILPFTLVPEPSPISIFAAALATLSFRACFSRRK